MPRPLRIFLTGLSFVMFFLGSMILGAVLFPLLLPFALFNWQKHRDRCTAGVGWGYGTFLFWMRLAGLIDYGDRLRPPPELEGKSYVLIANHPTLIDVLYLLHWFRPRLTCVVKGEWYRSIMFGTLLKSTHYLPNDEAAGDDVVERMVEHLQAGHPLMVFPEGTRSAAHKLRRFKRGAFEAAIKAGVPIVRVFIRVDKPMLMKGVPFWKVPDKRARWDFELLDVIDTTDRSGLELRNEVQADYMRRFDKWLDTRERPAFEVAGHATSAPPPG